MSIEERLNQIIRVFLYLLIIWVPYSNAAIEICVVVSMVLWLIKRGIVFSKNIPQGNIFQKLKGLLKSYKPVSSPLNWPILFFVGACIVSVGLSEYFSQSWHNFLTKTLEWFIIYFLAIEVFQSKKHVQIALTGFTVTLAVVLFDGFIQYYITGKDLLLARPLDNDLRATASFTKANGLGAYLTVVIPLLFVLALRVLRDKIPKWNLLVPVAFICSIWLLILTFSRGAWVSILFSLLVLVLISAILRFKSDKNKIVAALVAIVLFSIIGVIGVNVATDIGGLDRSIGEWRFKTWQHVLLMIEEKPLFGHGVNTFMDLFQNYRPRTTLKFWPNLPPIPSDYWPTYAHNCYLQITAEIGLIGLFAFLSILYQFFRYTYMSLSFGMYHYSDKFMFSVALGLFFGIFAFLVHAFFDTHFYSLQLSSFLWIMIGLQVVLNHQLLNSGGSYGKS